jgi:thiol:disulfide interchange protein
MLTVNLGPLTMGVPHLLLIGSLLLAMLTGWWVGRACARNPEQQVFRLLLVALLVARLAFVVGYFEHYQGELWRVIDIRDGGFLDAAGLNLQNVLLDSDGRLGQHVGSMALPTTLFYDADGRQVGSHLGELSRASLARALEQLEQGAQP